jgi:thiamine pyrophosphate-dependent acetolactate synthase large subunit-like protein
MGTEAGAACRARINFDPAQSRRGAPPDVAILADARVALAALAAALGAKSRQAAATTQAIAKVKAKVSAEFDGSLAPQMSFLRAIREATPEDAVFVADYIQVAYVATAAPRSRATANDHAWVSGDVRLRLCDCARREGRLSR